jgi:F-type H+-transporting ATPase subunit a
MEGGIHIALSPYVLGELWGIPITSTLLSSWLAVLVLAVCAVFIGMRVKIVPGKGQVLAETFISGMLGYMTEVLEDKKLAERFFPLIATIFLFILSANLLGLFPFVGSVGITEVHEGKEHFLPFFYPTNTDLNVPLALAIIAFLSIEFAGITALGFLKYAGKFVNFKSVIGFCVGLIELVSEVARLVTFSFRLFGNIFAGKVLILVALFFVPYVLPVPLLVYELFVSFIQAAVFSLLTLFFIKIAVTEPHEEH